MTSLTKADFFFWKKFFGKINILDIKFEVPIEYHFMTNEMGVENEYEFNRVIGL